MGDLPEEARFAAALASLGAGPRRLRMFLDGYAPADAWEALSKGKHRDDPDGAFRDKACAELLERVSAACAGADAAVRVLGRPDYPAALAQDPQAPAVVFSLGDPARLDHRPLVAIVGTRSATTYGLGIASELGRGLAEAGVGVVSGLAQGIDSAAHAGAVAVVDGGPPAAVLGAALDAPVPAARRTLLDAVACRGTVLSELPPGTRGAPGWWFAVRNRVMAALAHVVVVVESHLTGGSWYTVSAAAARGVTVAAVPGSVRSPASAGSNRLLVEGAVPVRDVDDVLTAVELALAGRPDVVRPSPRAAGRLPRRTVGPHPSISPAAKRVRRVLDHDPAPLDVVVRRTGLALGDVALALEQLAEAGLAVAAQGFWSRPR